MNKEEIILIGGGGHCNSVIDVIELENKYTIAGIIDVKEKIGQKTLGYTTIADDDLIPELVKKYKYFHISLGFIKDPQKRIKLFSLIESLGGTLPVIISPYAIVSKHSSIGKGTIIMHNAQINANANIGLNCIINSKALVEHDAIIGSHSHISTGAIVNGTVNVGESCFIGSGAVIVNNTTVPKNSFIKANQLFK